WEVADTAAWRAANSTRAKTIIIPMQEQTLTATGKPTTYNAAMGGDVYGVASVRKFDDPASLFSTNSSTRDVVLARVGETYLVAAEAYFKAGNSGKALERINEVRRRAALPGYDLQISESDLSIDFILDERGRELAGEYHRWMDLKRTGKLIEYCVKYNPEITGEDFFKGTDGQNKILRPIPRDAIDLNHADVQQNPGY
ncbi:MAG TPA: RagB/SusD family nutrient uptake outer membrane protein, partial [Dysgonomonas sp.]|nr:RagB/SusD family nutrient uptake outer membrane protein [Dysgonomonas sp.]